MTKIYGIYKHTSSEATTTEMELLEQHHRETGRVGVRNGCLTHETKAWIAEQGWILVCNRSIRI